MVNFRQSSPVQGSSLVNRGKGDSSNLAMLYRIEWNINQIDISLILVPKISAIENTAGSTFSMGHINFTSSLLTFCSKWSFTSP